MSSIGFDSRVRLTLLVSSCKLTINSTILSDHIILHLPFYTLQLNGEHNIHKLYFSSNLRVAIIKANFSEKAITNNKIYDNLLTTILYNIYKLWLKERGLYIKDLKAVSENYQMYIKPGLANAFFKIIKIGSSKKVPQ